MEAMAAVAVGEGSEVEAVAGAQGGGDAVVVVGVVVEGFALAGYRSPFDGLDVLMDVADVPGADAGRTRRRTGGSGDWYDVVAVGSGTEADIGDVVPVAAIVA